MTSLLLVSCLRDDEFGYQADLVRVGKLYQIVECSATNISNHNY